MILLQHQFTYLFFLVGLSALILSSIEAEEPYYDGDEMYAPCPDECGITRAVVQEATKQILTKEAFLTDKSCVELGDHRGGTFRFHYYFEGGDEDYFDDMDHHEEEEEGKEDKDDFFYYDDHFFEDPGNLTYYEEEGNYTYDDDINFDDRLFRRVQSLDHHETPGSMMPPGPEFEQKLFGWKISTYGREGYCSTLPEVIAGPFPAENLRTCQNILNLECYKIKTAASCPCYDVDDLRMIKAELRRGTYNPFYVLDLHKSCKNPFENDGLPFGVYLKPPALHHYHEDHDDHEGEHDEGEDTGGYEDHDHEDHDDEHDEGDHTGEHEEDHADDEEELETMSGGSRRLEEDYKYVVHDETESDIVYYNDMILAVDISDRSGKNKCYNSEFMSTLNDAQHARCVSLADYVCSELKTLPKRKKGGCEDDPEYLFRSKPWATCENLTQGASSPREKTRNCNRYDFDTGKFVFEHCRESCESCSCRSEDSKEYYYNGQVDYACNWISLLPEEEKRWFCRDEDVGRYCSVTCEKKCCKDDPEFEFLRDPPGFGRRQLSKKSKGKKSKVSPFMRCKDIGNASWMDICKRREVARKCPMKCRKCLIKPRMT